MCTYCTYNIYVNFDWDENKRQSNLVKHGVDFADAVTVFFTVWPLPIEDRYRDEERFIIMGMLLDGFLWWFILTATRKQFVSSRHVRPKNMK